MRVLAELEIGVMFWAGHDPAETLAELTAMGVQSGQLGIPGDFDLPGAAHAWKHALQEANFKVYTVFAAYRGESYADIATVRETVGFVPVATRVEREERTFEVARFANDIGVRSVATHIGYVPGDRNDPEYASMVEMVRRVCDYVVQFDQSFALETGQEPAAELLAFLHDVNRGNLGINFDPANMVLYGNGDPIAALQLLHEHILSVHCKDGDFPPPDVPGALGKEKPLGQGSVGIKRFVSKLRKIGYHGPLAVEREAHDPVQRLVDIREGIRLLRELELSRPPGVTS
jgi:sugar phosphate isomerase/epimerase